MEKSEELRWKSRRHKGKNKMKSIQEIKDEFKAAPEAELSALCGIYKEDERKGVQNLILQANKKMEKLEAEKERIYMMQEYERKYEHLGYVCGIDEAGRGPFAGPVVAAAVILPKNCELLYVNDSKQLSEKKREELYVKIRETALAIGVGYADARRIDQINILQATYEAMREAVSKLRITPQVLLNDAVTIPGMTIPQVPIVKGDAKSLSIAAASIIAKVTRDRLMREYDKIIPGYGFASNKGYGSPEHIEAIRELGITPLHRRTFIKNVQRRLFE